MRTQRRFAVMVLRLAAITLLTGGAGQAKAGLIPLPTTLDQLLPAGNFAFVGTVPYTFSNFTFSSSAIPPTTSVLNASAVTVSEFHAGIENGLAFSGSFFAPPGTIVDYAIGYMVTAPAGVNITDATLSSPSLSNFGGTGLVSIAESLVFPDLSFTNQEIDLPGSASSATSFPGVASILVEEDILINGGSLGASVGDINNGFSSPAPPPPPVSTSEPSSLALLALGGVALAGWRRWKQGRRRVTA